MVKKLLTLTGIIGLLLFFPSKTQAVCYPLNSNTGLCDAGSLCPGTIQPWCCTDIQNDCNMFPKTTAGNTQQSAPSDTHTMSPYCNGTSGINTALGCIPTSQSGFFGTFFRIGIGMAGGIAFLLIIYGGLKMMLSAGNPEQLNEAREMVTSAVTGLLLIIFSVLILKFIGVNILGLPGFG